MSKARVVSKQPEIIRNHSVELFDIFTLSKETALGLTLRLYQSKIMDRKTKSALFSSAQPQQTANVLMEYLEMKVDQSPKYLPMILKSMKEEEAMKDLVEKVELELSQIPLTSSEGMVCLFVNLIFIQPIAIVYLLFGTESHRLSTTLDYVFAITFVIFCFRILRTGTLT